MRDRRWTGVDGMGHRMFPVGTAVNQATNLVRSLLPSLLVDLGQFCCLEAIFIGPCRQPNPSAPSPDEKR